MATTKKTTATAKTPAAEPAEPADTSAAGPAEPAGPAPSGYAWVTRRRSTVMLGTHNPMWTPATLVDVKSLPELEAQGYVVVDGPDDVPKNDT